MHIYIRKKDRMTKRPTMQDVADRAGVSRGTVDRVIKNRPHVKPEVYDRVMQALKDTGYLDMRAQRSNSVQLPLKLGVLMPDWTGLFRHEILRGIEDARAALTDLNVEVIVKQCTSGEPEEALKQLDAFAAEEVDGLSVCCVNDVNVRDKINALAEKGVLVITYNSDLPGTERLFFVGQDPRKSGRIAGEIMRKFVRDEHILICCGNLEFTAHMNRVEGFTERMGECGFDKKNMTVLETYNDYGLTKSKLLEQLKLHKKVAVYMANRSVTGCVAALEEAKKRGKVRLICHDFSDPIRDYLKDGTVDFTIAQDIHLQGYLPLILLRNHLHHTGARVYDESQVIHILCAENL
ncbi:MAG: LacI family DNA-binding transcriptional regulator [Lachnospiraceae bacterium]|nr:LacI family DNA-binding transcriptional regulator [Lachnospiraceae bacterium]